MKHAIEARDLTRYYGKARGVSRLDLMVPEGSIFGLLGENASGKTTAMQLAMGHLQPDRGSVRTLGVDAGSMPPATRARIGWLSDRLAVPTHMNLETAMLIQRDYFPTWDAALAQELQSRFGLSSHSIFGTLSLGQKRRFMITLVLAQRPELMVLDEPAAGLDTAIRREFIDILLEEAADRPMTIVLSSHILSDVERLIDTVAFMKDGRIAVQGNLEDLRTCVKRLHLSSTDQKPLVQERFRVLDTLGEETQLSVVVEDFDPARLQGIDARVEHLNLEELFLVYNAMRSMETAA